MGLTFLKRGHQRALPTLTVSQHTANQGKAMRIQTVAAHNQEESSFEPEPLGQGWW